MSIFGSDEPSSGICDYQISKLIIHSAHPGTIPVFVCTSNIFEKRGLHPL